MNGQEVFRNKEYLDWLSELKARIRTVQIKAAFSVSRELLSFYWDLRAEIVRKQKESSWGEGLIVQLSKDLVDEFPGVKGFSVSNLR